MPLSNPSTVTVAFPTSSVVSGGSLPASVTAGVLLGSNSLRKGAIIWNNSTANLYIDFGNNPTLTVFMVKINAGGYYEVPFGYTGAINGIWDAANGTGLFRELT